MDGRAAPGHGGDGVSVVRDQLADADLCIRDGFFLQRSELSLFFFG